MKKIMLRKLCAFCLCAYVPFRRAFCLCAYVPFRRAFTLIELMIVIVVIAILVSITLPVSKYVARRAREASQKIYVEKIKSALEDYRAAYGEYPITSPNEGWNRHYPENYSTVNFYYLTNSPYTNVDFTAGTVETLSSSGAAGSAAVTNYIDYALTYPLMLKQREQGARPFMEFPDYAALYIMVKEAEATPFYVTLYRRLKSGGISERHLTGFYAEAVNRPKAIDPVTLKQWQYTSDGVTYSLAPHTNAYY